MSPYVRRRGNVFMWRRRIRNFFWKEHHLSFEDRVLFPKEKISVRVPLRHPGENSYGKRTMRDDLEAAPRRGREIALSLKTPCPREARRRAARLDAVFEELLLSEELWRPGASSAANPGAEEAIVSELILHLRRRLELMTAGVSLVGLASAPADSSPTAVEAESANALSGLPDAQRRGDADDGGDGARRATSARTSSPAGKSGRRVVSAFMATAFARDATPKPLVSSGAASPTSSAPSSPSSPS